MSNVRIITPNSADEATLTASPVMETTLPVEYLQDQTRARVARTTGLATPQHVYGNWSGPRPCSGFVLWRHNLTAAATLRLILYEGQNQTGTVLYDSGSISLGEEMPAWGEQAWGTFQWGGSIFSDWPVAFTMIWFDQVSPQSFDLQMTDSGNTAGYMQAARLVLGPVFEPADNFSWGVDCHWEEDSSQERTDGGTLRTDASDPYRVWTFALNYLTDGERATLTEMMRVSGKRGDLFISCFPGMGGARERDYAGLVKLVRPIELPLAFTNNWRTQLTFAET
ncbi:MAG: hypothetical protein IT529_04635 [Burkholderiales bacterium]|nr:hypothetical protein [Burkholderiales bacterium]